MGLQPVTRSASPTTSSAPFSTLPWPTAVAPPRAKRALDAGRSQAKTVAQAFHDACLAELDALKPGNVHRFADDHRMSVDRLSRRAHAPPRRRSAGPGFPWAAHPPRVEATRTHRRAQHQSRHHPALLLLSPPRRSTRERGDLRERLGEVLARSRRRGCARMPIGRSAGEAWWTRRGHTP